MSDRPSDAPQPPAVRIGNAERDVAEARLHRAVADGALTLDEFSERMTAVLASRTQSDLDVVLEDLPAPATAGSPSSPARTRGPVRRWLVAIMSGEETKGRWRPAPTTHAVAIMGGVEVDLRDAEVDPDGFQLNATAVMGGIEVIVPEGMAVDVGGFAFMGGREVRVADADPDAPVIRIDAYALMGGVEIRNPTARETEKYERRHAKQGERQGATAASWRVNAPLPAVSTPRPPARRQGGGNWFGRVLVGAVIAAVLAPWWLPGESAVAVFGGRERLVSQQEAENEETINAATMFGGVQVIVPDGVAVEMDGLVIFGGATCDACGEGDAANGTVHVRAWGAFGGITVQTQSQNEAEDNGDDD
jgi:Domain of unknown function (DUF1707)